MSIQSAQTTSGIRAGDFGKRHLESVADVVYPPRAEPVVDSGEKIRKVGAENYVNRLWMFVSEAMSGSTQSKLLLATLGDFGARIDAVYSQANKGVHAERAVVRIAWTRCRGNPP